MSLQKLIDNLFKSPRTIDMWNDFMDSVLVEKLKEDYLNALKWSVEPETLFGFQQLLKYYMVYEDYLEFMKDAKHGSSCS